MLGMVILLFFGHLAQGQSFDIRSHIGAPRSEIDAEQRRSCLEEVLKGPLKDLEGQLTSAGISKITITFSDENEARTQVMGHLQNAYRLSGWQTYDSSTGPENLGDKNQGDLEEIQGILPLGTVFYEAVSERVAWGKYELKFIVSVYYGPTYARVSSTTSPRTPDNTSRLIYKTTFNAKTLEEGRQRVLEIAQGEQKKFKLAPNEEYRDMRIVSGPSEAAHRQGQVTFSKTGIAQTRRYVGPMLEVTLGVDAEGNCNHKVNSGDVGSSMFYFYDARRTIMERAQRRATGRGDR